MLDIGCNAGFYAIEMKRRGAERVVGIDTDEQYLAQARFAAEVAGVEIELASSRSTTWPRSASASTSCCSWACSTTCATRCSRSISCTSTSSATCWCSSRMLRGSTELMPFADDYPFGETASLRRPGFPQLHFVEHRYAGDPTNWWIPNRACVEAMLRSAGFEIIEHPEEEVYVCRRVAVPSSAGEQAPAAKVPAREVRR